LISSPRPKSRQMRASRIDRQHDVARLPVSVM
jgi:hypothetical protein